MTAAFCCLAALKLLNNIENVFVCSKDLLSRRFYGPLSEGPCDLLVTSISSSSEDLLGAKYLEGSGRRKLQCIPPQGVTPIVKKGHEMELYII